MDIQKLREEKPFLYLVDLVFRNFKFAFITFFSVMTITVIILLLIPRTYQSSMTLILPKSSSDLGGLGSLVSDFLPSLGGLGGTDNTDKVFSVLESRSMKDSLIALYDLQKRYDIELIDDVYKTMNKYITYDEDENSNIVIYVEDKDPLLAQDITNKIYDIAQHTLTKIEKEEKQNKLEFIEFRYKQNLNDLKNAEEALRDFQKKNHVIEPIEQYKANLEVIGEVTQKYIELDLASEWAKISGNTHTPSVKSLEKQRDILSSKINKYLNGDLSGDLMLNLETLPEIGLEYLRLYREVEIQQEILKIILPIYEQTKMDANKSKFQFIVLDKANVPVKPFKPNRKLWLALAMALTGLFILCYLSLTDALIIKKIDEMTQFELKMKKYIK